MEEKNDEVRPQLPTKISIRYSVINHVTYKVTTVVVYEEIARDRVRDLRNFTEDTVDLSTPGLRKRDRL